MTSPDPLEGRVRESLSVLVSRTPLAPEFDELPEPVSARPRHPVLVVGLATVAAVTVAVAGLALRESPDSAVDTGGTTEPSPAPSDTATTSPVPLLDQMETVLYMFHQPGESGRLVRLDWVMEVGSSPFDRLQALFAWRPPATSESGVHQLVNAVPERASVLSATLEPGTTLLTVDTEGLFTEEGVRQVDLMQALAQVVWTATQDPAVTEVQFRSNGVPMQALTSELRVVNRPVNRSDYPLGSDDAKNGPPGLAEAVEAATSAAYDFELVSTSPSGLADDLAEVRFLLDGVSVTALRQPYDVRPPDEALAADNPYDVEVFADGTELVVIEADSFNQALLFDADGVMTNLVSSSQPGGASSRVPAAALRDIVLRVAELDDGS